MAIETIQLSEVEKNLPSGVPANIRALDSNGNSISSDLESVAKALPKKNEFFIYLEPDETYSLSEYTYSTVILYETLVTGDGCIALLCWEKPTLFGGNIYANIDTPEKICVCHSSTGASSIINRTSVKRRIKVNII